MFYPVHSPAGSSQTGLIAHGYLLKQRYRILGKLGQGGFGAVYKAEDIQLGNRLVAVKEMSMSGLNTPQEINETARAFEREALMLANLRHQNLPSIHDHFSENGRWYLVMDFIKGETLAQYLDERGGKLSVQEALQIGIQLCTVLDFLHTRQMPIIYRDLTPSNIMLTPDGHVYLIDFGIARHFKPGQSRDTTAFGSAGYAAPEQYGRRQTTPRSDIYSLGAVLHHMLTGTDPSQNPFHFLQPQLYGPPAFSQLSMLIMQMLDMDEQNRPSNMALIKKQLQQILTQITDQIPFSASWIEGEQPSSQTRPVNNWEPLSSPAYQGERTQFAPPTYPVYEKPFTPPPARRGNRGFFVIMTTLVAIIVIGAVILVALLKSPAQSASNPLAVATSVPTTTTSAPTATPTAVPTITPTRTPTTAPTTAITAGQVLCQADWSQGMNGWSGSADWKVYNGELLNDGSGSSFGTTPSIIAPCNIKTGDYAVEVQAKMQEAGNSNEGIFGIEARGDNASNYYEAYFRDLNGEGGDGDAHIISSASNNDLATTPWASPGPVWHTYRFELQGTTLRLFIDGAKILEVTDYSFLTGWQVGMTDSNEQVAISSFKVIAL